MRPWTWPVSEGGRAFELLAAHADLTPIGAHVPAGLGGPNGADWVPRAASVLGIEAEPVSARHGEVEALVCATAPAIYFVAGDSELVVVARTRGRSVELLCPDGRVMWSRASTVASALSAGLESSVAPEIEQTLVAAGVSGPRKERVRRALLDERLAGRDATIAWTLRADPGEAVSTTVGRLGIVRRGVLQVAAHLARLGCSLAGWWVLGRSMFSDRLDLGTVMAACLWFASSVMFEVAETWLAGSTSLRLGAWLKQRLLVGALRLRPDDVRLDGLGAHLGRVIESESVQAMALSSATSAALGALELLAATIVLALGAGGVVHAATLVVWIGLLAVLLVAHARERRAWTEARLHISARGIERMLGHETRLVTERSSTWSLEEDTDLAAYVDRSRKVDASQRRLTLSIARGWLIAGLLGLIPALLLGTADALPIAVALGGVLLAYEALGNLAMNATLLVDALIGWRQVAPFFEAAARRPKPTLGLSAAPASDKETAAQLELRDVDFSFPGRTNRVLEGVSLRIEQGDHILLEGPSGAGKSALATLLGGLRSPSQGLVLHGGLDVHAIGEEPWRKSIALVPQFHENHVLTGTLAFNLLLGREWPPSDADLELAEEICRELGLGPLLERMPSQLSTMVGETGWQLSHGEKSRVFLARALLQNAKVVLLDETLAALDPENLAVCLKAALARAPTLLVIAHARPNVP